MRECLSIRTVVLPRSVGLLMALLIADGCSQSRPVVAVRGMRSQPETTPPPPEWVPAPADQPLQPEAPSASTVRGTGALTRPQTAVRVVPPGSDGAGDISFKFVNADVREIAREILGDTLQLNYVVDSKVQAMITMEPG